MSEVALTNPTDTFVAAGSPINCPKCGVVFWMTVTLEDARRADHKTFWCPNGHGGHWPQESEAQRYRRLYGEAEDRAAAARAERDQAEAGRRAWKGQATKLRKRVVEGECPFCGQHLRDLSRHVARKHADQASVAEPDE